MRSSNVLKTLAALLGFGAIAIATAGSFVARSYRHAAIEVCDLIEENYYRIDEPEAQNFVAECLRGAVNDPVLWTKAANAARINRRLQAFGISHLNLYSPVENRALWENTSFLTGLRARVVSDKLIVYEIVPGSSAEAAGFRRGDVIIAKDGEEELSIADVEEAPDMPSTYMIERRGKGMKILMRPSEVAQDLKPQLVDLGGGVAHLKIPSFLPQYFDKEKWLELVARLREARGVVVDLRGNPGGSFPAMMRALTPFRCEARDIGAIVRAETGERTAVEDLRDDLDTQSQLDQLERVHVVRLQGYHGYGCIAAQVIVLIDSDTSSVAEVFAEALRARPRSRVWGQVSAGQVVLAEWFPISGFGLPEYSLSIPIAGCVVYDGKGGERDLESHGVRPERALYYELEKAIEGRDSWLEDAAAFLQRRGVSP